MQKAGVDGVEVHAAHAHGMLGGFLTPLYNRRTDEYGGSLDARMRFLLEVIAEIRERCGKDFIIDVRISGDEYTDGGLTLNDMIYVWCLASLGEGRRRHDSCVGWYHHQARLRDSCRRYQQASHAACSREIKKHVNIPVATVGRINEAWIAEELIEDGAADICMMGRANLCDAEFCNKAAAGNADEIRPCIGCLRCPERHHVRQADLLAPSIRTWSATRLATSLPPRQRTCSSWAPVPRAWRRLTLPPSAATTWCSWISRTSRAARCASRPFRRQKQELTRVIKYQYRRRLAEAGVTCVFGTELTAEDIQRDYAGYEVVLAYGAEPIAPAFMQGFKQVMTADDLLGGKAFPGKKIVIVGGGTVGCETADYLAAPLVNDLSPTNRDVTVIEMTKTLAANEGGAGRAVLITRMLSRAFTC